MNSLCKMAAFAGLGVSFFLTACSESGRITPPPPTTYVLTVKSTDPVTGVSIAVTPQDNNGATSGNTSFTRTYNAGASVTLTAPTSSSGNSFKSWTGCTNPSTVSCTVALNANTTVTASYTTTTPTTYVLTVDSTNPVSGVPVTVTPADNNSAANGTTSFTRTYDSGTSVTLTAPATSGGNTFSSWTGCTSVSTVTCVVTLNADTTIKASYTTPPPATYVLTVDSSNPASGVPIAVSPADNNNAANGTTSFTRTYDSDTSVTLTAPATSGANTFSSWTGCTSATTSTCRVTLKANTTVTASYTTPVTPASTITCIGDSLTEGADGNSYCTQLAALSGITAYELGIKGQRSGDIAVRMNAYKGQEQQTFGAGFAIPISGSVPVIFNDANYDPVYGLMSGSGTLYPSGVPITLTVSGTAYTLNCLASGEAPSTAATCTPTEYPASTVAVPSGTAWKPVWGAGWFQGITLIRAGRNNYPVCTVSPITTSNCKVAADVAAMVAVAEAKSGLFRVLDVQNADGEPAGSASYLPIKAIDAWEALTYGEGYTLDTSPYWGGTFVDIRANLVAETCTQTDGADVYFCLENVPGLYVRTEDLTGTLTTAITSTTQQPFSLSGSNGHVIVIGTEQIYVHTQSDSNVLTSTRGAFGTTAGTYASRTAYASYDNLHESTLGYSFDATLVHASLSSNYTLTVNSTNPAIGVAIGVSPADNNNAANGTTSFTRTYAYGASVMLTAPATLGSNTFSSWTGCTNASTVTCSVKVNANMTVTANYTSPAMITPTVTVTPSASSITTAQPLTVTVGVSGGSGNPTPTGSVTLTSGSYTSAPATLSNGSATINVAAGSLATGTDTLTVTYTPESGGTSIYNGASGTASETVTAVTTYTLTVKSASPTSGVDIQAVPADINGNGSGPTPLTLSYTAGTAVTLSAPISSGSYSFASWTGECTSSTESCQVTMSGNETVTATYNAPLINSIAVTPTTATIGAQVQFVATVNGTGNYSKNVTWTLACPSCGSLSPGTLSSGGLYTTPYPAPTSVTVTATSTQTGFTNISGSATVTLSPPATAAGPALTVNVTNQTHAISPYIYGMNNYSLDASVAKDANITVDRFGGDATSRYNYLLDDTSSASDYYFENQAGSSGAPDTSQFNSQVTSDAAVGAKTLGTVDVLGWVAKDGISCSFPVSLYPGQQSVDPYRTNCGNGVYEATGDNVTGNDPTLTSTTEGPSFAGEWVTYLVSKFGTAADGGVFGYDLDNEPAWWDAVHRDVHPVASTYDEVTNNGIATAEAIKTADPTANVNGPVVDYWWNYFYSKKDIENGWDTGPCYEPWSGPTDRKAHGGVPFIEYYLQQFAAASNTYGSRLLDYLDMHTYFAANYNGNGVGLTTAGDTGEQQARLNSTRVFWDPTYTDSNYPQPNYSTDSNYTANCSTPLQAPQLIPMAQSWVAKDYPGTKLAFTEYNWGGQENINGAVAQADILGIFGSYGLDLGTLWGPPDPATQAPGLMAFEIYRNYDGNKSTFGNTSLASTSVNQGALSVFAALRGSDNAVTVVVINKTYGPLTTTLSLSGLSTNATTAQAYLYSNANLNAIVTQPSASVNPPAPPGTTSTIANYTFPAQSITLFVIPQ
jgi:Glycoside hydrolase family 44